MEQREQDPRRRCSGTIAVPRVRLSFALLVASAVVCQLCCRAAIAQDTSQTHRALRAVAGAVLKDATFHFVSRESGERYASPDRAPAGVQLRLESPYNDWRYWNGVLNIAMMRLGEVLGDSAYVEFSLRNVGFCFDYYRHFAETYNGQGKWEYPFGQRFIMEELDDCGAMGASVIQAYSRSKQERYWTYIEQAATHMRTIQHRLHDGTFVRPFPRKWTLWADDLYMSVSFLARRGKLPDESSSLDDAAQQVVNFHKHLFNDHTGLMYHYWYSDVNQGGVAYWGRANGWALLAQIDLLERLPKDHPQRSTLLALLQRHILGIARYQSGDGLWHQLLDKVDSYLETSCTAMFTYVVARAINKGYLEPQYASIAHRGWEGVLSRIRPDGQVVGVCAGTGVSDDLAFYYRRPTPLNDAHGIGAVLLAGAEVLLLPKR